jgi:hypothetical protein
VSDDNGQGTDWLSRLKDEGDPDKGAFWVVWNPKSEKPVRVPFKSESAAIRVARGLARKDKRKVYVMRVSTTVYP